MNFEEIKEKQQEVNEILEKYENNKIALRKDKLSDLYRQKHQLTKDLVKACDHSRCVIHKGYYRDIGYGCDRFYDTYEIYCNKCESNLIERISDNRQQISKEYSLEEIVPLYQKYKSLSDVELRNLGFSRIENVVRTTKYVKL